MKKNTKLTIAALSVIGAVSLIKTTQAVKKKIVHEKEQLELEHLLHKHFKGNKALLNVVRDLDDNELNVLTKVLRRANIE